MPLPVFEQYNMVLNGLISQGGSTNVRGSHHCTLGCKSTPLPVANPLLTAYTCYRVILTGVTLRIHKPALTFLLTEYYYISYITTN